jgi:hypothetical protein
MRVEIGAALQTLPISLSAPVPAVLMVSNSVFFRRQSPKLPGRTSSQSASRKRRAMVKNS